MKYTFTIQEPHFLLLKEYFKRGEGKERVSFIICGLSSVDGEETRFLAKEIHNIATDDLITSQPYEVTWNNNIFLKYLRQIEAKNLTIAIIHNHGSGVSHFSSVDDSGELELFKLAFNRNGENKPFASLIMMPDGTLFGRIWRSDLSNEILSKIRVCGSSIKIFYPDKSDLYQSPETFERQRLAFGNALVQDFSKLKITVVGLGATGSATAILLTRLGIGELTLIDKDRVEKSNLNRLHGARLSDIGKFKVEVLQNHINEIGLATKVNIIKNWVSHQESINHLKTSDIVFGCTDDNSGRILLNRFAYFYLTPIIDMGIVMSLSNEALEFQSMQGRISYLFPGSDCLVTKGIINTNVAYSENLKRNDPETYEQLKKEAYIIGEGNPAPAIVTFSTQISTMAVNELINRFTEYNKNSLKAPHKLLFFHRGVEIYPENIPDNDCRICGTEFYWGRGDMQPFMDMVL